MPVKTKEEKPLVITTEDAVKEELKIQDPQELVVVEGEDPVLDAKAEHFTEMLMSYNREDLEGQDQKKDAVEEMGLDLQKKAANKSAMLKQPIKKLSERGADGGEVANALVGLKDEVEGLDPGKFDFEAGWFTRTIGFIPGVGKPLKKYFTKYESAQTVIDAIIRSLENGRDQLKRDNVVLLGDQRVMREMTIKLEKAVKLAQLIDTKIAYKLETEVAEEDQYKFIEEELLFPLRQRTMDLQQQLVVNQQGVLALEIIMRNNKELMRGVNRALSVTVTALEVAVTVAMALANQKVVLDKIGALNTTTNNLIGATSKRLKTQGVAIQKQASTAQLDMETLSNSFKDINDAMDDISNFRRNALPGMADAVLKMDKMTTEAKKSIEKMEKGNTAKPAITIDVE